MGPGICVLTSVSPTARFLVQGPAGAGADVGWSPTLNLPEEKEVPAENQGVLYDRFQW